MLVVIGCFPSIGFATGQFAGIGDLAGGANSSIAESISSDGAVVVGVSSASSGSQGIIFTPTAGIQPIGLSVSAQAVSADGTTVVGGVFVEANNAIEPFIFTAEEGLNLLGVPPGETTVGTTIAQGVSADGSVVVGSTFFGGEFQAFRWTEGSGFESLQSDLPGNSQSSLASDISDDGTVIVGGLLGPSGRAFLWTDAAGGIDLGGLPGGDESSLAIAVSANGTAVVGTSSSANSDSEAFLWTANTGIIGLGVLSNADSITTPFAVTGSGEAVVGQSNIFEDSLSEDAFLWTEENGLELLQDVLEERFDLEDELAGWTLTSARDISSDGRFITGVGINPLGDIEGWVVSLNEPIFNSLVVPEPSTLVITSSLLLLIICLNRKTHTCIGSQTK